MIDANYEPSPCDLVSSLWKEISDNKALSNFI